MMATVSFAGRKHAPVNPCGEEGAHEGPRGYAHALKDGATFVVLDEHGDINRAGRGHQGVYHGDTRDVSRLALSVQDAQPVLLYAATRHDNSAYVSHLLSPELEIGGTYVDAGAIHMERTVTISASRYYEQLHLTSYALQPLAVSVSYDIDADFLDMFEIRGIERPAHGTLGPATWDQSSVSWDYAALDRIESCTQVRFYPAPATRESNRAGFRLRLEPRQLVTLNLVVDCGKSEPGELEASHCIAAAGQAATERRRAAAARCDIRTSNELYDRWLDRSAADLDMPCKPTAHGRYPFAGLPWFNALFGRDGIITALEALWLGDLMVGEGTVDLAVYRRAGKVAVAVARNEGQLQVQIVP
jgi:glycogen debranching enzyme